MMESLRFTNYGDITTADRRVSMYVPQDGLQIPRPYVIAPFKPSELGSNIRHIRKPISRELEI
jgi:hypothetical protein